MFVVTLKHIHKHELVEMLVEAWVLSLNLSIASSASSKSLGTSPSPGDQRILKSTYVVSCNKQLNLTISQTYFQ